jgi:hypothetical protein
MINIIVLKVLQEHIDISVFGVLNTQVDWWFLFHILKEWYVDNQLSLIVFEMSKSHNLFKELTLVVEVMKNGITTWENVIE